MIRDSSISTISGRLTKEEAFLNVLFCIDKWGKEVRGVKMPEIDVSGLKEDLISFVKSEEMQWCMHT